jgi:hypothetical protein
MKFKHKKIVDRNIAKIKLLIPNKEKEELLIKEFLKNKKTKS